MPLIAGKLAPQEIFSEHRLVNDQIPCGSELARDGVSAVTGKSEGKFLGDFLRVASVLVNLFRVKRRSSLALSLNNR